MRWLAEAAKTTRAVFTNEGSWVPSLMDALPRLELIVLVSNGHESIDLVGLFCRQAAADADCGICRLIFSGVMLHRDARARVAHVTPRSA